MRAGLPLLLLCLPYAALSQNPPPEAKAGQSHPVIRQMSVPAGTTIVLRLKTRVDTKADHADVFAETTAAVILNNTTAIPSGTLINGSVARVQRPGRVRGRAELQIHFNTLVFPDGHKVHLPGASGQAGVGLISVPLAHGQDVTLPIGASLEMILQSPLILEVRTDSTGTPRSRSTAVR